MKKTDMNRRTIAPPKPGKSSLNVSQDRSNNKKTARRKDREFLTRRGQETHIFFLRNEHNLGGKGRQKKIGALSLPSPAAVSLSSCARSVSSLFAPSGW
jgi:hypothetical protein